MKRIAYVSDAWHGYVSYVMPKALLDSFSDYEEDVILCHFNSFGSWSRRSRTAVGRPIWKQAVTSKKPTPGAVSVCLSGTA